MLRPLSGDPPRSRLLSLLLLAVFLALALAPFLFKGSEALDTAARLCIIIVLAASYDLLIGYAGLVSFAHAVFFAMGAYGVALGGIHLERGDAALAMGGAAGVLAAAVLALVIGLVSLRGPRMSFAMITLAVGSAAAALVAQYPQLTGGADGLVVPVPRSLTAAADYGALPRLDIPLPAVLAAADASAVLSLGGGRLTGRVLAYYLIFGSAVLLFLLMLRMMNAPFGRVLAAIRENEARAAALGYSVLRYSVAVTVLSAALAALAAGLFAIWVGDVGPGAVLGFEIVIGLLVIVVIGGMGTLYGAIAGAAVILLAQGHLPELMAGAQAATAGLPVLPDLLAPERWLLWLGVLLVLAVHVLPRGIVGALRGGE